MTIDPAVKESKSIIKLKGELIKALPFSPNLRSTKKELEALKLVDLLIIFLGWRSKLIPSRPRIRTIKNIVKKHPKWSKNQAAITAVMLKVKRGDDLTPYLSHKASKDGYTANQSRVSYWNDKDLVLNVTGFHHMHLDPSRTDDMLFVHVTRNKLTVHGIFDHSVFYDSQSVGVLNPERTRMLSLHENIVSQGQTGVHALSMLAGDGNPIYIVRLAQKFNKLIKEIDPQISDRGFIEKLYKFAEISSPASFNLAWQVTDSDLLLVETKSQQVFPILFGPT
jgi:hypothetical protein